jgi:phosphonate metabolism protein PhnG
MSHAESSNEEVAARWRAMGLFARARLGELGEPVTRRWPEHGARDLKPVETGLVMLRGRAGGDGAPFNVGEATVTRAIVELPSGERGYGHILGRDAERARLARSSTRSGSAGTNGPRSKPRRSRRSPLGSPPSAPRRTPKPPPLG